MKNAERNTWCRSHQGLCLRQSESPDVMVNRDVEEVKNLLEKYHQSHLLAFWGELSPTQRDNLLDQIEQLDFEEVSRWVRFVLENTSPEIDSDDIAPVSSYSSEPADPGQRHKYAEAVRLGERLISAGKVAAFVVAGGQGTRLGFDGPKGNFPISPVKQKTFFQIFAETIAAAGQEYETTCPWYIMTSPLNHDETVEIFNSNDFYGLGAENVRIFQQGTLPNFDSDGKILLADKSTMSRSPDGHGGSLKALHQSGALADMKKRGIEFISYWQVDNPLVNLFDPLFIGLHAMDRAEMSSKAVIKTDCMEKVGNFCLRKEDLTVIEYSEFNEMEDNEAPPSPDGQRPKLAERRNPDYSLVFRLGSIAIHIISTSFVERLNADGFCLPLHKASKKIPHIDATGRLIESDKPNGVKLETFIFDALPLATKSIILDILRDQEFAPTKNATGVDSTETTKQMMVARAAEWLESAGVVVPRKPDGSVDCLLEIAPSFGLKKADVKAKLGRIPQIKPGVKLCLA